MKFIHKTAEVQTKNIGDETKVWQFSVVLKGAKIGKDCNINSHCFIENDVVLGDRVTIKCGVYLWDGVSLDNDVFVGPNVTFVNDKYVRSKGYLKEPFRTHIKKGASLGAASTILGGLSIGEYAFIGAGSILTKNVAPHELWYGAPAVQKGYVCRCGTTLNKQLVCGACGKKYTKKKGVIVLQS